MTTIIAVANEKGGVAKTTTALTLAAAFAEMGYRVLAIDLDAQANLSLALGREPEQVEQSMANVWMEGLPLKAIIQASGIERLDLAAANSEIGMAERYLPQNAGFEGNFRTLVRRDTRGYDFVVIDCPPFLGAVTLCALNACHLLLIPTQAEYFSVCALRSMIAMIRRLRGRGNPGLVYRLVLTLYDRRNRIHRNLGDQLRVTFGTGLLETTIEVDTKLRESAIAAQPILNHAPKSRAAVQYRALAQEIIEYVKEETSEPIRIAVSGAE